MENRLSRIVTRTGDAGMTGLGDGSRVSKDCLNIRAIGDVDELNSFIGVLRCEPLPNDIQGMLDAIQHDLFDLGGQLCMPGHVLLSMEQVARLEASISAYNAQLPPLQEFILPGGSRAAALAHVARTVCRRAERAVVSLGQEDTASAQSPAIRQYLNRLSDLLFVLARVLNRAHGGAESQWRHARHRSK